MQHMSMELSSGLLLHLFSSPMQLQLGKLEMTKTKPLEKTQWTLRHKKCLQGLISIRHGFYPGRGM